MTEIVSVVESSRPALLLDVDGVLEIEPYEKMPADYLIKSDEPWWAYNPAHGDWLRQVGRITDIYYISDYRDESHGRVAARLGLPEYDWINDDAWRCQAKTYAAARSLAITALFGHRPLVWIDDEIGIPEFGWAQERNKRAPTLIVKTEIESGLQTGQMGHITNWLRTVVSS
jgi:hypothetical protein